MSHPDAISPEGWRIGAGFSEFLHGVGHGDLDELFEEIEELADAPLPLVRLLSDRCPNCGYVDTDPQFFDEDEPLGKVIPASEVRGSVWHCMKCDEPGLLMELEPADDYDATPAVCQHGRDDYCRPCLVRERAEERYLG